MLGQTQGYAYSIFTH